VVVALEVDNPDPLAIKYVPIPQTGMMPAVRLNKLEDEHTYIGKVRFRRAILFEVSTVSLGHKEPGYVLTKIGEFTP
jgi:hypothetical protein